MGKITLTLLVLLLSGCASWTHYQQRTLLLQGDVPVAPDILMRCVMQNAHPGLAVRVSTPVHGRDGGVLSFSGGGQVDIEYASAGSAYTILGGPRKAGKVIRGVITTCAVSRRPGSALLGGT